MIITIVAVFVGVLSLSFLIYAITLVYRSRGEPIK